MIDDDARGMLELAAEEAAAVALWAHMERDRLRPSLFTWARRRYLLRVFEEMADKSKWARDALEADR